MANVKPVPDKYHTATPYMIIRDAAGAIDFYKKAFGATEMMRNAGPDGKIGHAEIKIGDSVIMLADDTPDSPSAGRSAMALGGSPVSLVLYVEDVDAFVKRAIDAGAKLTRQVENQFYGDRRGGIADPFGNEWYIHTHIEDVTPEEMDRRAAAATGG